MDLVENTIDLKEVTVTPYNLSGQLDADLEKLSLTPAVNSSSLGLPNVNVVVKPKSERLLIEADRGKLIYYYGIALAINTHKLDILMMLTPHSSDIDPSVDFGLKKICYDKITVFF